MMHIEYEYYFAAVLSAFEKQTAVNWCKNDAPAKIMR